MTTRRGFVPQHPVVREAGAGTPGWRVPRTGRVLEALVPAVLEQKVTGREAWRAWRWLVRALRRAGAGPGRSRPACGCAPDAATWAPGAVLGLAPRRRRPVRGPGPLVTAAGRAGRLEAAASPCSRAEAAAGCGPCPASGSGPRPRSRQRALGDADAVSVGDFHLAGLVGWALVGEQVDDDAMLELLEPYRGHRYRAVRMIELSGHAPAAARPAVTPGATTARCDRRSRSWFRGQAVSDSPGRRSWDQVNADHCALAGAEGARRDSTYLIYFQPAVGGRPHRGVVPRCADRLP